MKKTLHIIIIFVFSVFLLFSIVFYEDTPDKAEKYLIYHGKTETGAVNIVTAIYLGYRAFDTLGETIVLITSVSGVVFLMGGKS